MSSHPSNPSPRTVKHLKRMVRELKTPCTVIVTDKGYIIDIEGKDICPFLKAKSGRQFVILAKEAGKHPTIKFAK